MILKKAFYLPMYNCAMLLRDSFSTKFLVAEIKQVRTWIKSLVFEDSISALKFWCAFSKEGTNPISIPKHVCVGKNVIRWKHWYRFEKMFLWN